MQWNWNLRQSRHDNTRSRLWGLQQSPGKATSRKRLLWDQDDLIRGARQSHLTGLPVSLLLQGFEALRKTLSTAFHRGKGSDSKIKRLSGRMTVDRQCVGSDKKFRSLDGLHCLAEKQNLLSRASKVDSATHPDSLQHWRIKNRDQHRSIYQASKAWKQEDYDCVLRIHILYLWRQTTPLISLWKRVPSRTLLQSRFCTSLKTGLALVL